jgi:hypothetical protein
MDMKAELQQFIVKQIYSSSSVQLWHHVHHQNWNSFSGLNNSWVPVPTVKEKKFFTLKEHR